MSKSRIIDGIIVPPTHLELIAVDHCNISCRHCNHASPVMPAWFANPDTVYQDFSILAKYYRPRFIKVIGGEPLMHKSLDVVINAARASGICNHFTLVTNGVLLDKASDAIWRAVDEIEISWYPTQQRTKKNLKHAKKMAKSFNKKLTVNRYNEFRVAFSGDICLDGSLVNKIHRTCKIANVWECHTARDGYFYKCPQSIYIHKMNKHNGDNDRIKIINDGEFQHSLLKFINSSSALSACASCLGTVGVQEKHQLLPRKQWNTCLAQPVESFIDFDFLDQCITEQPQHDDCKIKTTIGQPWPKVALSFLKKQPIGRVKSNIQNSDTQKQP